MNITAFPKQQLADWCREDGHDGCAIWIEESPKWLLPTVLWAVAHHVEAHRHYDDDAAYVLPSILRDEADALKRSHAFTLSGLGYALALGGVFALAAHFEYLWA